ncbi:MAG: hypothetical protein AAF530_23000 [Pseudomonadota bacterium]
MTSQTNKEGTPKERIRIGVIGDHDPNLMGGIRVHVVRLSRSLEAMGFAVINHYPRADPIIDLFRLYWRSDIVHVNMTNVFMILALTLMRFLFSVKSLYITVHEDVLRSSGIKLKVLKLSARLCDHLFVLNDDSRAWAKAFLAPSKYSLVTAFLPPTAQENLLSQGDKDLAARIDALRPKFEKMFLTYGSHLCYDSKNQEIYGVSQLFDLFCDLQHHLLIIVDPTGGYKETLRSKHVPENILFVNERVNFTNLINLSDAYIRNTTTDGDSIALREAVFYGLTSFATDVVSRPDNVDIYPLNDLEALQSLILSMKGRSNSRPVSRDKLEQQIAPSQSVLEFYQRAFA